MKISKTKHLDGFTKEDKDILHSLRINIKNKNMDTILNDINERWDKFPNTERTVI